MPGYEDLNCYDTECALIGAGLIRGLDIFHDITDIPLVPDYFSDPRTSDTWKLIMDGETDMIVIADTLKLTNPGADLVWLQECINISNAFKAREYAKVVWDYARKRKTYHTISALGSAIFKENGSFEETLDQSIKTLQRIRKARIE